MLRNKGLGRAVDKRKLMRDLRSSLDPEQFLRETIGAQNISAQGPQLIHSCPMPFGLHKNGDQNPSAAFNTELLLFNCMVCGGGDLFWLTQNVKDIDSTSAVDLVMDTVEIRDLTKDEFLTRLRSIWEEGEEISFSLPSYSERIIKPWLRYTPYMDERGVTRDVQRTMKTGIDLNHREKYEKNDFEAWLEQPRITIPLFFKGKLRGWQKRRVSDEMKLGPKYRSSPGLPKDHTLYGFDAYDGDSVYVVESPLTALKMMGQGYNNVVATLGARVTDDQIDLLRRYDEIHLLFDADDAGSIATEAVAMGAKDSCKVWISDMPEKETDPADYPKDALNDIIESRVPGVTWLRKNVVNYQKGSRKHHRNIR